ncbi:MAG: 3-dehydroquinate synthase [Candidatus Dormibacteria bacterium]
MTATHIVLVGLPGSGKSTVAPLLAEILGRRAIDTDALVAARTGRSPASIIAEQGESRFRAEELVALQSALASHDPLVVSAGGGLVAQPGVATDLARRATVVWLDAPDGALLGRLGADGVASRPLLGASPAAALAGLRERRAPAHASALLRVDTEAAGPTEVAMRIATALGSSVRVETATPYLVHVAAGALHGVAAALPGASRRVLLVADRAVPAVAETLSAVITASGRSVERVDVPGGEALKGWASAGELVERCSAARLDRDDCVVAAGGGTVGDVAGFAAATYLRGIAWVVVPTTLLGMVDSAVGGKTGVNLASGKNLAGAFWQPRAVICDPDVLSTLPERAFRSAFAEVVKTAMVGGDELATLLETRLAACLARDRTALADTIRACCALKAAVVAADERESGRRAILNYGHTVGHAVEALTGFGNGPDHGEAVAFGMRVAGRLSVAHQACPPEDVLWQDHLLDECGLRGRPAVSAEAVVTRLQGDKKARGGVPRWVLLRRRGEPVTGVVLEEAAVREQIEAELGAA